MGSSYIASYADLIRAFYDQADSAKPTEIGAAHYTGQGCPERRITDLFDAPATSQLGLKSNFVLIGALLPLLIRTPIE